jgi:hypothetical protein
VRKVRFLDDDHREDDASGMAVSAIVRVAGRRDLITAPWLQVIPVAGAALAYGIAAGLGGSGFIAAFLAGGIFGALAGRDGEHAAPFIEQAGNLLNATTFILFGAILLGPALTHLTWQIAAYTVLSLTLARMLPVALAMLGTGARRQTVAFLGWFGPRGLASRAGAARSRRPGRAPRRSEQGPRRAAAPPRPSTQGTALWGPALRARRSAAVRCRAAGLESRIRGAERRR